MAAITIIGRPLILMSTGKSENSYR